MIARERYLTRIIPFVNKPVIKVITGIRRCGKSTFLKIIRQWLIQNNVIERNILLINKDSLEFDWLNDYKQLAEHVSSYFSQVEGKKYLFIDEVQEIEGWEKALSGFLTDDIADLYITGSNSRMLSSDLATYIAGRYVEFKMYTLGFSEFLLFRGNPSSEKWEAEFQIYMRYGGFPGVHQLDFDNEVISQYLSSIYSTIVLKDVVARNNIRDVGLLERIAKFTAANCGNITSPKKISDFLKSQNLKSSTDTVMSYLNMLSAAFIFHKTNRFDIKGKRFLEIHEKYYVGDIGLKHSMIGFRFDDIAGHLENIVYLELLARGYEVAIGKVNDQEIDFVAQKNDERMYIQVAYLLTENSTIEREFGALEKINDNYPKMVLSLDKFPNGNRNGIIWQNLIDFLTLEK